MASFVVGSVFEQKKSVVDASVWPVERAMMETMKNLMDWDFST